MGVDIAGDGDGAVTENGADGLEMDAAVDQEAGERVAQAVDGTAGEAFGVQEAVERAADGLAPEKGVQMDSHGLLEKM